MGFFTYVKMPSSPILLLVGTEWLPKALNRWVLAHQSSKYKAQTDA